ncbi:hypothetical protein ABNX05_06825 [Lysinibacillus sp. M3]|uniref:Uncharacterized protein n=1 Tax=Lysinibacillus zambalensis TaxID=3160866 RepID=A0ABV1MP92_9BACI
MSKLMLFACSLVLLFFAGNAFYIAFKKYEEDDDFSGAETFFLIDLVLAVVLLIFEKFAPKSIILLFLKRSPFFWTNDIRLYSIVMDTLMKRKKYIPSTKRVAFR